MNVTLTSASKDLESVSIGGIHLGNFGNCVINVWSGPPSSSEVAALTDYTNKVCALWPDGATLLVVVQPGCQMPSGEQRRELDNYYLRIGDRMRAVAQVVEGGNLWAVAARSVMTALRLVQKVRYPMRVFADVEEGVEWIVSYVTIKNEADKPKIGANLMRQVAALRTSD